MDAIQNYKCPSCGDSLSFGAKEQTLHCDSCGNDFDLETLEQLEEADKAELTSSKYDWSSYEPRSFGEDEAQALSDYSCPSCGAQITGDETLGATVCPYCGNATIVKKQFEGALKPDYVIPFKLDKKAAMQAFEKACAKAPFLPDEFKDRKRIEEMSGVYVPFWMFDCDCDASIRYNAQRVRSWSDSNFNYTKTSFFRLIRSGNIAFANIPVDGSKKADDAYMEALEPFDYSDAVDFNTAYLSGYLADKYDVSAEDSRERANQRVRVSTEEAFRSTVHGYTAVQPQSSNISFSGGKIRYSLLPVWMLNIKYNGQNYQYAINGQTGKTVGSYPVCKKKRNKYFLKVLAISLGITAALALTYLFLM